MRRLLSPPVCLGHWQTGSGKTVTMMGLGPTDRGGNAQGLYGHVADAIFGCLADAARQGITYVVRAGFFEIYRGKCADLLNKKKKIEVMEDEHGLQQMVGLQQVEVAASEQLLQMLARTERTTKATCQNEVSSRSHAILQLTVALVPEHAWQQGEMQCKLSLVDLAGSEWAAKAQSDDRGNRLDGAEINKSLLCLKECIRALGRPATHVAEKAAIPRGKGCNPVQRKLQLHAAEAVVPCSGGCNPT